MSGNHPKSETDALHKFGRPLLWGVACACALCAALLLLMAALLSLRDIPLAALDALMVVASAAGAFGGAYLCARMTREKGMVLGMLCGGALFLLLGLCSLVVTGGPFTMLMAVKLCALLLLGALGGIAGVNRRARRK